MTGKEWLNGQEGRWFLLKDGAVLSFSAVKTAQVPTEDILATFRSEQEARYFGEKYRASLKVAKKA